MNEYNPPPIHASKQCTLPPGSNKGTFQPYFTVLASGLGTAQKNLPEHLIRAMTPASDPTILTLIWRGRSPSCLSVRTVECCSPRVQAVRKVAHRGEKKLRYMIRTTSCPTNVYTSRSEQKQTDRLHSKNKTADWTSCVHIHCLYHSCIH